MRAFFAISGVRVLREFLEFALKLDKLRAETDAPTNGALLLVRALSA